MVGEQATFVPAHAEVIDKDRTGRSWFSRRVERAFKWSQNVRNVFVYIANLTRHGSDDLGLIGWQMCQCLGPFRMLHLCTSLFRNNVHLEVSKCIPICSLDLHTCVVSNPLLLLDPGEHDNQVDNGRK